MDEIFEEISGFYNPQEDALSLLWKNKILFKGYQDLLDFQRKVKECFKKREAHGMEHRVEFLEIALETYGQRDNFITKGLHMSLKTFIDNGC